MRATWPFMASPFLFITIVILSAVPALSFLTRRICEAGGHGVEGPAVGHEQQHSSRPGKPQILRLRVRPIRKSGESEEARGRSAQDDNSKRGTADADLRGKRTHGGCQLMGQMTHGAPTYRNRPYGISTIFPSAPDAFIIAS